MDWQNRSTDPDAHVLHATAVSFDGRGVLISGPSGSGKSSLALHLMAFGAALISDDRVHIDVGTDELVLRPPKKMRGVIEARGFGLLAADHVDHAPCALVVDLATPTAQRLPECITTTFQAVKIPYLSAKGLYDPAPAILQFLKSGFAEVDL